MFNSSSKFQGLRGRKKRKIWQLFRATDFESLMYPCFTFCRILGIFPYKINASTIKICKPSYILSIIIICIFCTVELIHLYTIDISKNLTFRNVGTTRVLERNSFYICGGFIVVITFILSGQRIRFLETILKLSVKLPSKSYQNLSKLIHTKDILGFISLTIVVPTFHSKLQFAVWQKIHVMYIACFVLQMDMLYVNCVCILKACFKQINDNLTNLREFVMNDEPYLLSGVYNKQRNPFLLMEIIALKKQHLAINNTVMMLEMVFSLQLVSSIVMSFLEITFNLYFYLLRIQSDEHMSNLEKQTYYEIFITTVIFYLIKLALIVWACETGKNQAMKISSTVHEVFNSTRNEKIKYELHLFSLQLSHCKNIFSAKWVTVDATLLTAIAGGITTYLLILIQFLFTSNSCNGKDL